MILMFLILQDNEMVQKDNSSSRGGGVTWACEFLDQSMVCPLLVEDLSNPGQMLIEVSVLEQLHTHKRTPAH